MSRQLITEYRSELDRIHVASGSKRESVVREAFKDLLKRWGKGLDLIFLAEHEYIPAAGNRCYIDGALVHSIRVPFGYWEAKDTNDQLDEEIRKKSAKGYPRDNIIYEDTATAVLIQNKREVARVAMEDAEALFGLLECFFAFERPEIADFRRAVKQFASDLPAVLTRLREIIAEKRAASRVFARAEQKFLEHAREAINPAVSAEDVQEMLIQHVLTEDIFAKVFNNPDFHRKNNVAHALYELEEKLFGYGEKQKLLLALRPYYVGIESTAALIESHSEKQQFLKGLYENFYRVYNPLAADRLGVVYTPGEIVRFMVRSTDWLCHQHFGRGLDDRGVEILDPATGTGTFIVELLEHFRGKREKLAHKYKEELHANEVAILPYYVANLNIEATYQSITGQFAEFPGLVFVDTLDNVDALGIYSGHQHDLLGAIADENAERIKRQNRRKISVIIGNPPYNANQKNENENNKNRSYPRVDERIKNTYIKHSKARKPKTYDPYARFIRWASDRLSDQGVIAFITNRSFLDADSYDGFRRTVAREFSKGFVIDLGGDYKSTGVAGSGNVFGIGTGVAISFWVKTAKSQSSDIDLRYLAASAGSGEDKLSWLATLSPESAEWESIDIRGDAIWLSPPQESNAELIPIGRKGVNADTPDARTKSIFKVYSLGVSTNRDDWLYARDSATLVGKTKLLVERYNSVPRNKDSFPATIKWSRNLKRRFKAGRKESWDETRITPVMYRPFSRILLYRSALFIDELGQADSVFPIGQDNVAIVISKGRRGSFSVLATDTLPALDWYIPNAGQYFARYRYNKLGERLDNISDWALNRFVARYGKKARITKDSLFAYCYAVLHNPAYREKYQINLKHEFPHIPYYTDFNVWSEWGETLLKLHLGYDEVEAYKFQRIETAGNHRRHGAPPKPKLKSDAENGLIIIDEDTQLTGVPKQAWDYRLGNRSAIDWVLDQYKEKSPRDPVVREKFLTYRLAEYKEPLIDLLSRIVTVSLRTVEITGAMIGSETEIAFTE